MQEEQVKKVAGDGQGFEITRLWAYIAVDPVDGDEGVVAAQMGTMMMPLVAADLKRLTQLKPLAQKIATTTGVPVKLVRFYKFAEVETLLP